MPFACLPPTQITGLVLAGGQGRRMGGADKGLMDFRGKPLAAWAVAGLKPQVGSVLISANRNREIYETLGAKVLPDLLPDFPGPLAGLHAGLTRATTPWLAACPCDTPFLPPDLVARLAFALSQSAAPLAVARLGGRPQPAFMLCRKEVLGSLAAWLQAGERRVAAWQQSLGALPVDFDDCPAAFANFNTPEDLLRPD